MSREPDGKEREAGEGRGRRSKSVRGMVGWDLWRSDASVKPTGPAPIIAILGGAGIVFVESGRFEREGLRK